MLLFTHVCPCIACLHLCDCLGVRGTSGSVWACVRCVWVCGVVLLTTHLYIHTELCGAWTPPLLPMCVCVLLLLTAVRPGASISLCVIACVVIAKHSPHCMTTCGCCVHMVMHTVSCILWWLGHEPLSQMGVVLWGVGASGHVLSVLLVLQCAQERARVLGPGRVVCLGD